jgi:hypothetical protein
MMKANQVVTRCVSVALIVATSGIAQAQTMSSPGAAEMQNHVSFCHQPSSNESLVTQGTKVPAPGNCFEYLGVAALATWYGSYAGSFVLNSSQNDVVKAADTLACAGDPASEAIAIKLLQVCQCHNSAAVTFIESNQDIALYLLRRHGVHILKLPICKQPNMN